jgi:RimJ/RimL family protein N-acetyltransferase
MPRILIQYFDSDGCDAAWQSVFSLKQEIAARSGDAPPIGTWQELRRDRVKAEVLSDPDLHALLIEDRMPKAYIYTQQLSGGTDDPTRMLEFDLLDEEPSDDLVAAFRHELLKRMHAKRAPAMNARVSESRQMNILKAIGARPLNRLNYYRLDRASLAPDMLRSERTRLANKNPGIALRIVQYLDDAELDTFAGLFTIFRSTMAGDNGEPRAITREFLKRREGSPGDLNTQYHILAYAGREMIGHSNIWLDVRAPEHLHQFMTGVVPEYRGNEIGMLMKCSLYLELDRLVPEWRKISTDTLSTNVYMQAINEKLGFRLQKQGYEMMFLGDR